MSMQRATANGMRGARRVEQPSVAVAGAEEARTCIAEAIALARGHVSTRAAALVALRRSTVARDTLALLMDHGRAGGTIFVSLSKSGGRGASWQRYGPSRFWGWCGYSPGELRVHTLPRFVHAVRRLG